MKKYSSISKIASAFVILFIIFALIPAQLSAASSEQGKDSPLADQTWVRLGGPMGGIGYDIKVSQDNPDIMYVTDAYSGIHKSINGGLLWNAVNEGINIGFGPSGDSIPVFSVTIDPNDSRIIWIGMQGFGAVFRSSNGGETWEKRSRGIIESEGISIRGISVQPGNSDVVYIAGEISSSTWAGKSIPFHNFDVVKGVVYKSTDSGMTWSAIWRGDNLARYVLINPDNPDVIYISTGIFDRIAANAQPLNGVPGGVGIIKSEDGGQTWKSINNGLKNLYIGSLAMRPDNPNILIAGAGHAEYGEDGGVYQTIDGGESWAYLGGGQRIISVDFAPSNPEIIYAADNGYGLFYRSDDGGLTWKTFKKKDENGWGPPGIFAGWPIDIQVDPRNPLRVFVNNYEGGNLLSEDGGETWRSASVGYTGSQIQDLSVSPNNPAYILSTGQSGSFRSIDGGINWESMNGDIRGAIIGGLQIVFDPQNQKKIFMSNGRLTWTYMSTDEGSHWDLVTNYEEELMAIPEDGTGGRNQGLSAIAIAPSDSDIVYGGLSIYNCGRFSRSQDCQSKTIFSFLKSIDGGHSWTPIEETPFNGYSVTDIEVHPKDPSKIWVSTAGYGVYYSEDGGTTWESGNRGFGNLYIMELAIDNNDLNTLFAGTDGSGIYKSTDGGISWSLSSIGMDPNEPIWDIAIDPKMSNIIYAASLRSGVYLSEDAGRSWNLINTGLTQRAVKTLTISTDGETLYAGTDGSGVFRLSTHDQSYFNSLAPAPTPTPSPSPTPTPFSVSLDYRQDFESGSAPDWELESPWNVSKVEDNYVLEGSGHYWANLSDRSWTDSVFRFRIDLAEDNSRVHVNTRLSFKDDDLERYFVNFDHNNTSISKQLGPNEFENRLAIGPGIDTGWHEIEIQTISNTIRVLIDGIEVIAYIDDEPFSSGGIAFESLDEGRVLIDDIEVLVPVLPTPTPQSKATEIPQVTPILPSPSATPIAPVASTSSTTPLLYVGAAIILLLGLILLGQWRHRARN